LILTCPDPYVIKTNAQIDKAQILSKCEHPLHLVGRVLNNTLVQEALLDSPHANKAAKQVGGASLVVGAGSPGATERLLANDSTSALDVDVEVASSVAELLLREADSLAVLREDRAGESVLGSLVDGLADIGVRGRGRVVVDVDGDDGAEELGGEERVVGVGGAVDGGVDVVALGGVVLAADDELELGVGFGGVDDAGELVEGLLVDDGADEVVELFGGADLQLGDFGLEHGLGLLPEGLGVVGAGGGGALLALEFEGTADCVDDGVVDVGRLVDQVEVLATGLTDDAWVALELALGDAVGDLAVQRAEDSSGTGVVESRELRVGHDSLGDLNGIARHELDDVRGKASLKEDLVQEPVGSHGARAGLPDNDIAHQRRCGGKVASNGCEVEGSNRVDETLQSSVFHPVPDTRAVVYGLLCVEVLRVLHVEPQEIAQLRRGVDLRLPCVLALAQHSGGHDIVAVLGADKVGCLEEDGGTVGEGHVLP